MPHEDEEGNQSALGRLLSDRESADVDTEFSFKIQTGYCPALGRLLCYAGSPLTMRMASQILQVVKAGLFARTSQSALAAVNPITTTSALLLSSVSMALSDLGRLMKGVEKDCPRLAGVYFRQALLLAVPMTVISSASMSCVGDVFEGLGQSPDVAKAINDYYRAFASSLGVFPFMGMMILRRLLTALGAPVVSGLLPVVNATLVVAGSAVVLHEGGGPDWFGHAASVSNWLTFLGFLAYCRIDSRFEQYALFQWAECCDRQKYGALLRNGLPLMASSATEALLVTVISGLVGRLGPEKAGAYSAVDILAFLPAIVTWTLAAYVGIRVEGDTAKPMRAERKERGSVSGERLIQYRQALCAQWYAGLTVGAGLSLGAVGLYAIDPRGLLEFFAGKMPDDTMQAAEAALVPVTALSLLDMTRILTSIGMSSGALDQAGSTTLINIGGLSAGTALAVLGVLGAFGDVDVLDLFLLFSVGVVLASAVINVRAWSAVQTFSPLDATAAEHGIAGVSGSVAVEHGIAGVGGSAAVYSTAGVCLPGGGDAAVASTLSLPVAVDVMPV